MGFQINELTEQVVGSATIKGQINVTNPTTGGTGFNLGINTSKADPENFVFNGIVIFIWLISIVTVLTFVYAGVKYLTSAGDAEKAESGKKIMTGSIVGMLIIMASIIIFNFAVAALNKPAQIQTQQGVNQLMEDSSK